ncbi:hypothetical protein D8666_22785 [Ochrobactrum soli]|uniref:hypothetical protein n=1 Tax=Brucella/Ochrobactrum group TaxID=2826938 RepID=UPI000EF2381A|nr:MULTISPECIES: hypothetical protein [Brucella]MDX4076464.1 hypothetical protein [Brucella sp. NBRC 113783]RLL64486.1 hypothetical protein D8666_22785 [[Ochrobactrum] soli]
MTFDIDYQVSPKRIITSVLAGAFISTIFLLVFYPGFLSNDSIFSWKQAVSQHYDTIKPPLMALIQRIFYLFSPSGEATIASFSWVQGTLLWSAIFMAIALTTRTWRALIVCSLLMLCLMPLWVHTNVHWTDMWVFAFAYFGLFSFFELFRSGFVSTKWLLTGSLFFFISISIRYNAVSSLPLVAVAWYFYLQKRRALKAVPRVFLSTMACVVIIIASKAFLLMPGVEEKPSMIRFALYNQYLGTIVNSDPDVREKLIAQEKPYYDAAFGEGTLEASIPLYLFSGNGAMFWPKDALIGFGNIMNNGQFIVDRLPHVVWQSPKGFMRHKMKYITGQLNNSAEYFPMHPYVDKNIFNVFLSPKIPGYEWTVSTLTALKTSFIFKHWPALLLGLVALVMNWRRQNILLLTIYIFGVLYAVPYMVSETGLEWRYLLPSYISGYLVFFVGTYSFIESFFKKGSHQSVKTKRLQDHQQN